MNRSHLSGLSVAGFVALLLMTAVPAAAQVPPFFNGGGGIFDPEIDVIESGTLLDAQAVVSADRKYVTLTMRPQNTQLLALREFAFQTGGGRGGAVGGGAVGAGVGFGADGGAEGTSTPTRDSSTSAKHSLAGKPYPKPNAPASTPGVLERPGMTLVGRVTPAREK